MEECKIKLALHGVGWRKGRVADGQVVEQQAAKKRRWPPVLMVLSHADPEAVIQNNRPS
jgi:hypothetical protein